MCNAAWLSQYKVTGEETGTARSRRSDLSQRSSQVVDAIARYSASAEERETTLCFFVRQDMGLSPRVMK